MAPDGQPDGFEQYARAGLEQLGIEVDDEQLAVMTVVDAIYRPHVSALLAADLDEVDAERDLDLSRAPVDAGEGRRD